MKTIHREGLAMPGVDSFYPEGLQLFDAGMKICHVIDHKMRFRFEHIQKQVAAKQVAARCKNADGTLGMPWKMQNFGIKTVLRKIISAIHQKVWAKRMETAWFHRLG